MVRNEETLTKLNARVLRINPVGNDLRHRQRELALIDAGCDLGMVVPDRPYAAEWLRSEIGPEIPHWRSPLRNSGSLPFHLWSTRAIRRAIEEFRPDLIDVHEDPFYPAAAQAVFAARGHSIVLHADQNLPKRYPPPFSTLRSWVFRRVTAIYPSSTEGGDVLRHWGYRGTIRPIPYGVDTELFDAHPTGDRVGFVGRFVESKGILDLLPLGARLLCIGSGPLEPVVRDAGAEVRRVSTVFELRSALEEMGVLAMPSLTTRRWKEQFGRSAAEAMAAGLPVVAYASGALPEVIGDVGVLVPEGDGSALRAAIEDVLVDRTRLGSAARERARAHYAWPVVARQMIELYAEALNGRP